MALSAFFGRKKSPADLIKTVKESLVLIDKKKDEKSVDKAREELTKSLTLMKIILYGSGEKGSEPDLEASTTLAQEFASTDMMSVLALNILKFDFEGRRIAAQVFNGVIERAVGSRLILVDYVAQHPDILFELLNGYGSADAALACGSMLRECFKHEALARMVLFSESFFYLAKHVDQQNFEISSDAFATLRQLLTVHKTLVCEFLDRVYDKVVSMFTELLTSTIYVTRRQSLKLLGELLLARHNYNTMTKFISSPENLKLVMNLLRDESKIIQFEAFHIFKVFVANPAKPAPIKEILLMNKGKLVGFLQKFLAEKTEDDNFVEEKQMLIEEISKLS